MRMSTKSPQSKIYKTRKLKGKNFDEMSVHHRQELIHGFDQKRLSDLLVLLVGAGGLGGEVAEGLARKGVGEIHIFDSDDVEITNLNRQKFFRRDLYKNKAIRLAKNIVKQATGDSVIAGYPYRIQEAVMMNIIPDCDVAVVLVDNDDTRAFCSKLFDFPVIFSAVSINADRCYTMVQVSGNACYRCVIPEPKGESEQRCYLPSCIDVNKLVAALVLYAIDSLIMDRERQWNYKEINLGGFLQDRTEFIEKNQSCPLCGRYSQTKYYKEISYEKRIHNNK